MKTKLAMCHIDVDEMSMEITVSDVQKIDHVPNEIFKFIRKYLPGKQLNDSGLPNVLYLGCNQIKVTGAFTYGEISFIEVEGNWKDILLEESFICISSYHDEEKEEEIDENKSVELED